MADFKNQKERLKTFISAMNLTNAAFEKSLGLSNGYINSMRKGLGYDKLEQVSNLYADLNMGWLLTGEGEMLKISSPSDIRYMPRKNNMETIKDRLKYIRDCANMGQTKFEEYVGLSRGYFNKSNGNLSSDTILKMLSKFPDLNIEWLISGKGKPFKEEPNKEDESGQKDTEKYYRSLVKTRDELFSVQIDYIFQSMKSNNVNIENLVSDIADIKNKIDLIIEALSNQSKEKDKSKSA